mmetsp:Transcript_96037/g.215119  ORF Transcript_96037/g.215119 Transcript_96037/m.215119 type:complete len:207 (-) Transcript_96037:6025-6645(-)
MVAGMIGSKPRVSFSCFSRTSWPAITPMPLNVVQWTVRPHKPFCWRHAVKPPRKEFAAAYGTWPKLPSSLEMEPMHTKKSNGQSCDVAWRASTPRTLGSSTRRRSSGETVLKTLSANSAAPWKMPRTGCLNSSRTYSCTEPGPLALQMSAVTKCSSTLGISRLACCLKAASAAERPTSTKARAPRLAKCFATRYPNPAVRKAPVTM